MGPRAHLDSVKALLQCSIHLKDLYGSLPLLQLCFHSLLLSPITASLVCLSLQTSSCDVGGAWMAQEGHMAQPWCQGGHLGVKGGTRSQVSKREWGRCTTDPRPPTTSAATLRNSPASTDSRCPGRLASLQIPGAPSSPPGVCLQAHSLELRRHHPETQSGTSEHMLQPFVLQVDTPGALRTSPRGPPPPQ